MHGGPTSFWVSTYISYLLYKAQDLFSTCRQSYGQKLFFLFNLQGGPVFASQIKKLRKRMCMVDQLPYESVRTPAISCKKLKIYLEHADSPMATNFSSSLIHREDQSLLNRPRNSGRECAWWTNSLVGQYLHQLSLVQSSGSIQHMQTVLWQKTFLSL